MKVYRPGTEVLLKIGNIKGIITGVLLRRNDVEYYIRHLDGGSLNETLLSDYEFTINKENNIGFGAKNDSSEDIFLLELKES